MGLQGGRLLLGCTKGGPAGGHLLLGCTKRGPAASRGCHRRPEASELASRRAPLTHPPFPFHRPAGIYIYTLANIWLQFCSRALGAALISAFLSLRLLSSVVGSIIMVSPGLASCCGQVLPGGVCQQQLGWWCGPLC